jgi:hypothetical protein
MRTKTGSGLGATFRGEGRSDRSGPRAKVHFDRSSHLYPNFTRLELAGMISLAATLLGGLCLIFGLILIRLR